MIIDLEKFLLEERPVWSELEALLKRLEDDPQLRLSLPEVLRFHYLYQKASADLARLVTFAHQPEVRAYLESLVARSYSEIHETRSSRRNWAFRIWLFQHLPQTFRRYRREFGLSLWITLAGMTFGWLILMVDPSAKEALLPFAHLQDNPTNRVLREEAEQKQRDPLQGQKTSFSSELITHNIKVSILTMCLGVTWGFGTLVMLFYNGVILGAVSLDYAQAGEFWFLLGWLLPHGSVEIPAILVAGQAGFVLAGALIGWGNRIPLSERLRKITPDLVTLISGAALLLVWAGIVEAFLSQYHAPVLAYSLKIAFGALELAVLFMFLAMCGKKSSDGPKPTE